MKVKKRNFDVKCRRYQYELAITDFEVKDMFEHLIQRWFSTKKTEYNEFIRALLRNDVKYMNIFMNKVALTTFSYFDTGKKPSESEEPERFYHGFVLGLLIELKKRYYVVSNRESGYGRYDVMLKPRDVKDQAYVLEFKVYSAEEEKNLQDAAAFALRQIDEKQYDAELISQGIAKEQIHHYGFAFQGKKVLIEKAENDIT